MKTLRRLPLWIELLALPLVGPSPGSGPFGIDHELARKYQTGLEYGVIAVEIGKALWFGNDDELGHTMWQTLDSSIISGIASDLLKRSFSRARPDPLANGRHCRLGFGYGTPQLDLRTCPVTRSLLVKQ